MKFNLNKKEFKPFDLVITFESKDEVLALLTLMANTEIQTWMFAPELTEILEEISDGLL